MHWGSQLISAMTKIHQYSIMCTPTISQYAAIEALNGMDSVIAMRKEYDLRRNSGSRFRNRFRMLEPGAFYVFHQLKI